LRKKINSPQLDTLLGPSRSAYINERSNFMNYRGYSRLFDAAHLLTIDTAGYCSLHTDITFSVIQSIPARETGTGENKYNEISTISGGLNLHKKDLINAYPYLQKVHSFAGYQALLRSVRAQHIDVFEVFSGSIP
jgi:hypothetical protein